MAVAADSQTSPPRYSQQFFDNVTFSDLPSLSLPSVLPNGSLVKHTWVGRDTGFGAVSVFRFGERIPSLQDLSPIMQVIEEKQIEGYQGVELTLTEDGWCAICYASIEMVQRFKI